MYDVSLNNKMPICEFKEIPKGNVRYPLIKDGKRVWVDGPKPNPYKDLDVSLMTLKSRIESNTFEDHQGQPRKLEKAQGSDAVMKQLEEARLAYENAKSENRKLELKKEYEKIYNQVFNKKED